MLSILSQKVEHKALWTCVDEMNEIKRKSEIIIALRKRNLPNYMKKKEEVK